MTDEQIIQALVAQGWKPNDVDHNECAAYRLGWEARGKKDAEVCERGPFWMRGKDCAKAILAIAREGT